MGGFSAAAHPLPAIWQEMVDSGLESGRACGKSTANSKELHWQYLVPLPSAGLSEHGSIAGGPLQGSQDGSEQLPP